MREWNLVLRVGLVCPAWLEKYEGAFAGPALDLVGEERGELPEDEEAAMEAGAEGGDEGVVILLYLMYVY
jgi:hypothetical protein